MQQLMRLTCPVCPGGHIFKVTLQRDQPVQLLQAQGGGEIRAAYLALDEADGLAS